MQPLQEWDWRRFLILLTRYWWWPVLTCVGALTAAWIYLRYTLALYKTETVIQIDLSSGSDLSGRSEHSLYAFPVEGLAESYMELFSTHDVILSVVQALELDQVVYSIGKFGKHLLFPSPFRLEISPDQDRFLTTYGRLWKVVLRPDSSYTLYTGESAQLSGKLGKWKDKDTFLVRLVPKIEAISPGTYLLQCIPLEEVVGYWQGRITVAPKRGLTVLSITVIDYSPSRLYQFSRALLDRARSYEQNIRKRHYDRALRYVDTLLNRTVDEIKRLNDTLLRFEMNSDMAIIPTRRQKALALFSELEPLSYKLQLQGIQLLLQQVQAKRDSLLQHPDSGITPLALSTLPSESMPGELVAEVNRLIAQRMDLLEIYQPNAPIIKSLSQKILATLNTILKELKEYQRTLLHSEELKHQEWLSQRQVAYRDIQYERQLALMQENIALRRELYRSLLDRRIQLGIWKEATASLIRVNQPPSPAILVFPSKLHIYLLALAVGIISGIGGIFLKYVFDQKVSYRVDLEGSTPIPIIAEIPYSQKSHKGFILSNLQLEVLRSLRNALSFLWEPDQPRLVTITSTVSGEGKTFAAYALAYAYAITGSRVLLIDADLRRSSLSHWAGYYQEGLSLLLNYAGELSYTTISKFIHPLVTEGLFLLPAGPNAPNPAELIGSANLPKIIQALAPHFDYIIIDTAPLGLVSDALPIIQHHPFTIILYVFRSDYSRLPFLRHLSQLIQQYHLKKIYLLFNGTKLSRPRYGYGYGYGYYSSEYGNGYYRSSVQKTSFWQRLREQLPL
ncbi:MAG: AAA family ATPase [Bacteroidia bacterium]|nr:AAA family ATPase [Bacteroidia bacterium]MDW8088765.1 AAA family ATPase [Bacteroidia bacterium]